MDRNWRLPAARTRTRYDSRYASSTEMLIGALAGALAGAAVVAIWRSTARPAQRPRRVRRVSPPGHMPMGGVAYEMISSHPDVQGNTNDALIRSIEECYSCAQSCTACADACLAEPMVKDLRQCIRLNLDCADACVATGAMASRRTGSNEPVLRRMLELCAMACRACGDECERHASKHEHCRICAEACRRCEHACRDALRTM